MKTPGIVIHWDGSDEYVQLDVEALAAGAEAKITTTSEWWPNERRMVTYHTTSEAEVVGGEAEVTLHYDYSKNQHLKYEETCWGKSVICFLVSKPEGGVVTWFDDDDKERKGVEFPWTSLASKLQKNAKREYYSRLQREQDIFRTALRAFDKCCVISTEPMAEVLEAAHIIPSKMCGAEVVGNGILLRADLHRLYDSGCFVIDPSGKVIVVREVSPCYGFLYRAQLPEQTVRRVSAALEYQWKAAAKSAAASQNAAKRIADG